MALRIVSLNIENSRHLSRVVPFLRELQADVVCFQEVMERDLPIFEKEFTMQSFFDPLTIRVREPQGPVGTAILSRFPMRERRTRAYHNNPPEVMPYDSTTVETKQKTTRHMLLDCVIEKERVPFRIATTHFTWTPDGIPNAVQQTDMRCLIALIEETGEMVLCGDFNAPRWGEIFSLLSAKMKDNVPAGYTTSIDGTFHRAGQLELMVDGLFSTPGYRVSDVEMICGLSDHCALVGTIENSSH